MGISLTIPLVALPSALKDKWVRFAVFTCAGTGIVLLLHIWLNAHYVAPLTAVGWVVIVQCMRYLSMFQWRTLNIGKFAVTGIVALHLGFIVLPAHSWGGQLDVARVQPAASDRQRLIRQLESDGNLHLVLVHYSSKHDSNFEWVYNQADIDHSKIVWARDMGSFNNEEILKYFAGRKIWLLEADSEPPRLVPIPEVSANHSK